MNNFIIYKDDQENLLCNVSIYPGESNIFEDVLNILNNL